MQDMEKQWWDGAIRNSPARTEEGLKELAQTLDRLIKVATRKAEKMDRENFNDAYYMYSGIATAMVYARDLVLGWADEKKIKKLFDALEDNMRRVRRELPELPEQR